jgi:hypothetical protein
MQSDCAALLNRRSRWFLPAKRLNQETQGVRKRLLNYNNLVRRVSLNLLLGANQYQSSARNTISYPV